MSEYVFCHADALLADGRWHVRLNMGEAWWADDPLVDAYPQYFSTTPLSVQGTVGRLQPGMTPLDQPASPATVPVVDEAEQAVAAINDARRGRPRRDQARG